MDIGKISGLGTTGDRSTPARQPHRQEADPQTQTSERGLVPLALGQSERTQPQSTRPSTAFLAQLIATAQHAPQTRARGRIAPADAIAHYTSAVSASVPTQTWDWSV